MRFKFALAVFAMALTTVVVPTVAAAHVPARFFGIAPQTRLTGRDAAYMRAGGIRVVRWSLAWGAIQPSADGGYRWGPIDHVFLVTARHRLAVLPFLAGTPSWLAPDWRTLPVATRRERHAWAAFLAAAVRRYGPGGGFWAGHGPDSAEPLRAIPVRSWQIWNEANFFYFARPISPRRYGRLLEVSSRAIRRVDPRARVILSGLFGDPHQRRRRGMTAARFLAALYRLRGIRSSFDGIALHPYAAGVDALEGLSSRLRRVADRHGDAHVPLYITEMGWGSQRDPDTVSFERGPHGQARALRNAYRFLLRSRRRLRLRQVFWFSWKDLDGSCSFCDSAGLFRAGPGFDPKPAWRSFVAITGGRPEP